MANFSIRTKLLIIFTIVFTLAIAVFGAVAYWRFSDFAVELAKQKLQSDANSITDTTIRGVFAEEIQVMVEEQSDDHELRQIYLNFFRDVQNLPVYEDLTVQFTLTYVNTETREVMTLVNVKDDAATALAPIETRTITDDEEWESTLTSIETAQQYPPNRDETGLLITSSAPVLFGDGTPSGGVLNAFIQTDDQIAKVRTQVRNTLLISIAVIYPLLLLAITLVAYTATRVLNQFAGAARALARGEKYQPEELVNIKERGDELGDLARVFDKMAVEVQAREEKLKQEVVRLKVEIDFAKQKKEVEEITESDYFKELKEKKEALKSGKTQPKPPAERNVSTEDYMSSLKDRAALLKKADDDTEGEEKP